MSTQKFSTNRAKGFKGDPPNAGLVHADMSYTRGGKQAPLAIELINPKMSHGTLRFDIKGLAHATDKSGYQMKQVGLFIDSFVANVSPIMSTPTLHPLWH